MVQQVVDLFIDLTKSKTEEQRFELVNVAAPQCLRSLRKMGLRDETDRLLQRLQESILGGTPPAKLRERYAARPDQWGKALQSLLTIAGGWRSFGLVAQAQPILDLARAELTGPHGLRFAPKDFTALAQATISALGHGPVKEGLAGIAELFAKMDPAKVVNSFTTAKYYSRFHLNLVEEVTLVLVSEDFSLGAAGRRWLEEDEFVIRRRVHAGRPPGGGGGVISIEGEHNRERSTLPWRLSPRAACPRRPPPPGAGVATIVRSPTGSSPAPGGGGLRGPR